MELLAKYLLLLPVLLSFLSAAIVFRQKDRNLAQSLSVLLLLILGICFSLCFLSSLMNAENFRWTLQEIGTKCIVPLALPLSLVLLNTLCSPRQIDWQSCLLFLPWIVLGTATSTLLYLLFDQTDSYPTVVSQLYLQVADYAFPTLLIGYGVAIIWRGFSALKKTGFSLYEMSDFFSKDQQIPMLHIFGFVLMKAMAFQFLYGVIMLFWHETPLLVVSFIVIDSLFIAVLGLLGRRMNQTGGCSLSDLKWNSKPRITLAEQYTSIDDNTVIDFEELKRFEMMQSLEKLMKENKLFLKPELSIDSLAAELCSNRLYLSRLINTEYGSNFREFLNRHRIEYAQQFMLKHPEANQDTVATASGFLSAQAFNKKFKEIVGLTPKSWCVMRGRESTEIKDVNGSAQ